MAIAIGVNPFAVWNLADRSGGEWAANARTRRRIRDRAQRVDGEDDPRILDAPTLTA